MSQSTDPSTNKKTSSGRVASPHRRNQPLHWAYLLMLSAVIVGFLEYFHAPAALLLGPMIAAILLVITGHNMSLPTVPFRLSQSTIGIMMAAHLPLSTFSDVASDWPVFLFGTLSTLVASGVVGVALTKSKLLPGTTAIWGASPGAAGVMTIMSEGYGADMRLVAVMQYTRVAFCALAAMVTAGFLSDADVAAHEAQWWLVPSWMGFGQTVAFVVLAYFVALFIRISGSFLLVPLALGFIASALGWIHFVLPEWFLALAFALLGWAIGFRFTPAVVRHALHVFPYIVLSIVFMLVINFIVALMLVAWIDIDFLSAFLGTSPGGADSVAIIAANIPVDTGFVMTMQICRFLMVMVAGLMLAQWLSNSMKQPSA